MGCNSAIYTVNSTNSIITTNAGTFVQAPLGSVIRRFGRNLGLDGDSIICCGSGYYDCDCSITLTPTAAGDITAQLYQDGMPVPGAFATVTGVTATTTTLPISALVRNCGCDCNTTLSVRIDAPCTLNNLALVVKKV